MTSGAACIWPPRWPSSVAAPVEIDRSACLMSTAPITAMRVFGIALAAARRLGRQPRSKSGRSDGTAAGGWRPVPAQRMELIGVLDNLTRPLL